MTSLKVALIGYGLGGKIFHAPLIESIPEFKLCAIVSSRREEIADDFPDRVMAETTDDADLVVISTPDETHVPLARLALEAGKHVVVDKPFALSVADAQSLVDLAEAKGKVISVYQNRRWDSEFLGLREVIDSGRLGRITQFESRMDRFRPDVRRGTWREQNPDAPAFWFDLGPHLVDQALVLFGLPRTISLFTAKVREDAPIDDWFHAVLQYSDKQVILHASALVPGETPRFSIHGTGGSWIKYGADVQEDQAKAGMARSHAEFGLDLRQARFWDSETRSKRHFIMPRGDHSTYYRLLRDCLLNGAPNPVPPAEALRTMVVLEAGAQSLRTGATVTLAHQ